MKWYTATILLILAILSLGNPVSAQRQTGSIVGTVTDDTDSPLPGATITLSGPAMIATLTFISTENGNFRFAVVPPGRNYLLSVEMPGFQPAKKEIVIVQVGRTVTLSIQLVPATVEEDVTVTAVIPIVDQTSSKISVNYAEEYIQNLPLNRDYYDVIVTAPGIVSAENQFHRSFSSLGSTVRSNQVALDGLIMTNQVVGTNIDALPYDIIDEFEIELSAHPAEVGLVDGSYVNIVTKSGGNRLSGHASILFFNEGMVKGLIPNSEAEAVGLTRVSGLTGFGDFSLGLGGPILRDKLWFFFNGRYINYTANRETITDRSFGLKHNQFMTFLKLSYQPIKKLKLVGMWSLDRYDEPILIGSPFPAQWDTYYTEKLSFPTVNNSGTDVLMGTANWFLNQDTFIDARINYFRANVPFESQPGLPPNTPSYTDLYTNIWSGSIRYDEVYEVGKLNLQVSGTHFIDEAMGGSHQLKAGFVYENNSMDWYFWQQNPYRLFPYNGEPWGLQNISPYMGMFLGFTYSGEKGDSGIKLRSDRIGAYVQDSFTLKRRLTLNVGLRYDETHGHVLSTEYNPVGAKDPVLTMLAPDIFSSMTLASFDDVIVWRNLSPRLGAVFDIFADGTTIFKTSWSRYHDSLLLQYFTNATPNPFYIQILWSDLNKDGIIDANDQFVPQYIPPEPGKFKPKDVIDPDLSSPYTDEFVVGIERELFRKFSIGLSYIHKYKKNIIEDVEKLRGYTSESPWWVPYTATEPGWDGIFGTADDSDITVYGVKKGAPPSQLWTSNLEEAKRKYHGFQFTLNKRMSEGWQLYGSITWSKYEGNIGASYTETTSVSDAFDNPNWLINRYGKLDFDRTLSIKLHASVLLPYDVMVSASYFHLSGIPWARTIKVQLPDTDDFEYPGTFAEVSTTLGINAEAAGSRIYRSRNNLDLRVEKIFALRKYGQFSVFFDVLNVIGESWYDINQDPGGYVYNDGTFERWPWYGQFTQANGLRIIKLSARFSF